MNVKARLGEADIGWCLTMVSPHLSQYHLLLLLALLHRVLGTGQSPWHGGSLCKLFTPPDETGMA